MCGFEYDVVITYLAVFGESREEIDAAGQVGVIRNVELSNR